MTAGRHRIDGVPKSVRSRFFDEADAILSMEHARQRMTAGNEGE